MPMHKEILTEAQVRLLPAVAAFSKHFGLVGGTAVALQIGHRESIDFDLFPKKPGTDFQSKKLRRAFEREAIISRVLVESDAEFTFMVGEVKVTFYDFEYRVPFTERLRGVINMPDLLTLAAMKAFALGQRAKWKDYADLFFIIRDHYSMKTIAQHARNLFGDHFNERLFREQLSYFEDVNYKEHITYKPGFEVSDDEVKKFLQEASVS